MTVLKFSVLGRPAGKGSKRALPIRRKDGSVGTAVIEQPMVRSWENAIREKAALVYCGELLDEPVQLTLLFYFKRPSGHFGKRGVRTTAPVLMTVAPDLDKLIRTVKDALQGTIIRNDSRVFSLIASKRYGEPERVEVYLRTVSSTLSLDGDDA